MDIDFRKYGFILCLGLFIVQPAVAQNDDGTSALSFTPTVTTSMISIAVMGADSDSIRLEYTWERFGIGDTDWVPVSAMSNIYNILPEANASTHYRVRVSINEQGRVSERRLGPFRTDIDDDDDGLIDIYYLEDLDNVRHQVDGSGYTFAGSTKITLGCPEAGCNGYELRRDLDFAATQSYVDAASNKSKWMVDDFDDTNDTGWAPIEIISSNNCSRENVHCFSSIFEGNGHRISNLQINRGDLRLVGLFSAITGVIRNIKLVDLRVEGGSDVGGLVGRNDGTIINSNVDGSVAGASYRIGGLVGRNERDAIIINSYARGSVAGDSWIGGLNGVNSGRIINSYAVVDVRGMEQDVGGLVGRSDGLRSSEIVNSYAAGSVSASGTKAIGGLLGRLTGLARVADSYSIAELITGGSGGLIDQRGENVTVSNSYWDTDTSGRSVSSGGGVGKTTVELQTPTRVEGIYASWSSRSWDFGDTTSYPTLRYNEVSDANACDSDPDTALPRCGTVLPDQRNGLSALSFVIEGEVLDNDEVFGEQAFSSQRYNYDVTIPYTEIIQLMPYTFNSSASVSVAIAGDDSDYFENKSSGDLSDAIPLPHGNVAPTAITVIVTETRPTIYHFRVRREDPLPISASIEVPNASVNEGEEIILTAGAAGGFGEYRYSWQQEDLSINIEPSSTATLTIRIPEDFIARNRATQSIAFTLRLSDDFSESSFNAKITVKKINNGNPSFTPTVTTSTISIATTGDDPDGNGTPQYTWERPGIDNMDWVTVSTMSSMYSVPPQAENNTRYRVRISYTDAQGYFFERIVGPFRTDIDSDDDGLIDIYYLEDLDNVRHQADGSGYKEGSTETKITRGCPGNSCNGYELRRDLDFATTQSYINAAANKAAWTVADFDDVGDSGWNPIGGAFSTVFNGNGYTISNLQINGVAGQNAAGLFNTINENAKVEYLNLNRVTIRGLNSSIEKVGGIAGENRGVILNSHISDGSIEGFSGFIGGLVGLNNGGSNSIGDILYSSAHSDVWVKDSGEAKESRVGGLVGRNLNGSEVHSSYALGNASGACVVGGLVGNQFTSNRADMENISTIKNSYAIVNINELGSCALSPARITMQSFGGLVGSNNNSDIVNSYAAGSSSILRSGFIGVNALTTVISDSYWDSSNNSQESAAGTSKTTVELQEPTMAEGIYANWNGSDWSFGTPQTYPVLRYNNITDADACDLDPNTALPRCGTVLPGQPEHDNGLSALLFRVNNINLNNASVFGSQAFSALQFNYTVTIPYTTALQLRPYAINNANISIRQAGNNTDYFANKSGGNLSEVIPLPDENVFTTLTIVVADVDSLVYNFRVKRVVLQPSSISIGVPNASVNEGDEITLTAEATGGFGGFMYSWQQEDLNIDTAPNSIATLTVRISEDLIARNFTTQSIAFTLMVSDDFSMSYADAELIVNKIDNGNPSFTSTVTTSTISIATAGADPDGNGTSQYTWDRFDIDNTDWVTVSTISSLYNIVSQAENDARYRVQISYTDGQGYLSERIVGPFRTNIDDDDDGLIDIYYLEDLDNVRHQVDGSGYTFAGSTKITLGCPEAGCNGYELRRDLDFAATQSYVDAASNKSKWRVDDFDDTNDTGWAPIEIISSNNCSRENVHCFSSIFEGNGHRISNLQINRGDLRLVGLFSAITGVIRNIKLVDLRVEGGSDVGGLVGRNDGTIINSNVDGSVAGASNRIGGLVGSNERNAIIINSYARGSVAGDSWIGGLNGVNGGRIINSYAVVDVRGMEQDVGGLVGRSDGPRSSEIVNSYAAGSVSASGTKAIGGLLGRLTGLARVANSYSIAELITGGSGGLIDQRGANVTVSNSYWDTDTSGRSISSGGGVGKTTVELQTPTRVEGIYASWSSRSWDFGDTTSYPTLRHNEVSDANACDSDPDTALPRCGTVLPGQRDNKLSALSFVIEGEVLDNDEVFGEQAFSSQRYNYDVTIPYTEMIQLMPYTFNSSASISVAIAGDDSDYFENKFSGDLSDAIPLPRENVAPTTITVIITEFIPTRYHFRVRREDPLPISASIEVPNASVNEGEEITLTAGAAGGFGEYRYSWQQEDLSINTGPSSTATLTIRIPEDFIARNRATQSIAFTLRVSDDFSESSVNARITVKKIDNGNLTFRPTVSTSTIDIATAGDDPDGNGTPKYLWERLRIVDTAWVTVPATSSMYNILPQAENNARYRVRISYTDKQNYVFERIMGPFRTDIDSDDDGLIDIYYLEDLYKVRHQADGSGYKESSTETKITRGCPGDSCNGYELRRDLDFATTQSYINAAANKAAWTVADFDDVGDSGWNPIGGAFSTVFNGNGYTISNLQINGVAGQNAAGLFNTIRENAKVEHLNLNRVTIRGLNSNIEKVGGIAGENRGVILNSHISDGSIEGFSGFIGGLVGLNNGGSNSIGDVLYSSAHSDVWVKDSGEAKESRVGGLVGRNLNGSEVHSSYALGNASGACVVGGLVGNQFTSNRADMENISTIKNSYAIVNINELGSCALSPARITMQSFGGLVGSNNNSDIVNSYAAGSSSILRSGFIGVNALTTVISDSYWDSSNNSQESAAGTSKTTVELQEPTMAEGIYANWNGSDWSFGTAQTYPVLRYNNITDADACDLDPDTALPRCGTVLPGQPEHDNGLSALLFRVNNINLNNASVFGSQAFSALQFNYTVTIPYTTALQLRPYAINNANISIRQAGNNTDYFANKSGGDLSEVIPLPDENVFTTLTIVVADVDSLVYNFRVKRVVLQPISISIGMPNASVNEGDEITLTAEATGGFGGFMYSWQQEDLNINTAPNSIATLTVRIPEDLIARNFTTQSIAFTLMVSDDLSASSANAELNINKINNGDRSFTPTVTPSMISIAAEDDPDGNGISQYLWEVRDIDDLAWVAFSTMSSTYNILPQANNSKRYRVRIIDTDAQGYVFEKRFGPFRADIDNDDDGLVDIYYLEDLNNVRHQSDGSGYKESSEAVKIIRGCLADNCSGYELRRDLDFNDDTSYISTSNRVIWTSGAGWQPIGIIHSNDCNNINSDCFSSIFEGNGNRISNLRINRGSLDYAGLFSANDGSIRNIKLSEMQIEGRSNVGGLVGRNSGSIINSGTEGSVAGTADRVGALVGENRDNAVIINSYVRGYVAGNSLLGGISGPNRGIIINSYAIANVNGTGRMIGGLAAQNAGGASEVINSYARGSVSSDSSVIDAERLGGLLGYIGDNSRGVINSYSIVNVIGSDSTTIGGLIGARGIGVSVSDSYWDTGTSGQTVSAGGGISKTTAELQTPTTAEGIYANWNENDWDFDDSKSYPALRYGEVGGVNACDSDPDTALPRCDALLPGQRDNGLSALFFVIDGEKLDNDEVFGEQAFSSLILNYDVTIPYTEIIQLNPHTVNSSITVSITKSEDDSDYFENKFSGDLSDEISLPYGDIAPTTLTVTVTDARSTLYNFRVRRGDPQPISLSIEVPNIPVNEGDEITLTAEVADNIEGFMYSWQQEDLNINTEPSSIATLTVRIPEDFITSNRTTQSIAFTLEVSDGFLMGHAGAGLIINKINNSNPNFSATVSTSTISIATVGDDPDGIGTSQYIWEARSIADADWVTVSTMSNTYNILPQAENNARYRVQVSYTDAQSYVLERRLGPFRTDIDSDNDGLIDIDYLEDLDKMRYQTDGSGYRESSTTLKITRGCLGNSCNGYELRRDLDFNDNTSYISTSNRVTWTSGAGWQPIGSIHSDDCNHASSNCFGSIFEGNGNRISNLQINRGSANHVGLFSANDSSIRNIRLSELQVEGSHNVGALVGLNNGSIINSGAEGSVTGISDQVGGLVGENNEGATIINSYARSSIVGRSLLGGLSGPNSGSIINSYAIANVSGTGRVIGGLAAQSLGSASEVINSYARGSISSNASMATAERLGGLLGYIGDNSRVVNSYSIVNVMGSGSTAIGGLIGAKGNDTSVDYSYWDTNMSGQTISAGGGTSKTTVELQTPMTASGIYANWSSSNWDFGDTMSYPALRYNEIDGVDACDSDLNTALPRCGNLLSGQRDSGLDALYFVLDGEELDNDEVFGEQPFSYQIFNYDVTIPYTEIIQLNPYAINNTATVSIIKYGDEIDYFENKFSGDLSDGIPLPYGNSVATTLTIIIKDTRSTTYNFRVRRGELPPISASIGVANVSVNEGDEITLTAEVADNIEERMYSWQQEDLNINTEPSLAATLSVRIPEDFIARERTTQSIAFTLMVSDDFSMGHADAELIVNKIDNGNPSFTPTVTTSTISIATAGDDPDGSGISQYTWERLGIDDMDWVTVSTMSSLYSIVSQAENNARYRVRISHTDAQGYFSERIMGPFRTDIDSDDDRLIDIYYLEDLYNVRYQADGSGYKEGSTATKTTRGCLADTCNGYELRRDLDFATTQSYINAATNKAAWTVADFDDAGDSGWDPINAALNTMFNGNGYTISNLQINGVASQNAAGLFHNIEEDGRVEHLNLNGVTIRGLNSSIEKVGSIAGESRGVILNSHISNASIEGFSGFIGGLVGLNNGGSTSIGDILYSSAHLDVWVKDSGEAKESRVGGLVGRNLNGGEIHNSYALGSASGACIVGGLVGNQFSSNRTNMENISTVKNSYAIVDISELGSCALSNTRITARSFGGLVANNNNSDIVNSYAAGSSSISRSGLVSVNSLTTVISNSYWDSSNNSQGSVAGQAKTTLELQTPTTASGIYASWRSDDWDFGNAQSYPALRYNNIADMNVCDTDPNTALPRCGTLLSGQRDSGLSALFFVLDGEARNNDEIFSEQPFSSRILNYDVTIPYIETIQLSPYAINSTAAILIMKAGDESDYFENKFSGDISDEITLSTDEALVTLKVIVTDTTRTTYTFTIRIERPFRISNADGDEVSEVNEGDEITLTAEIGDIGDHMYSWQQDDLNINTEPSFATTLTVRIPADFVAREKINQNVIFTLRASDDSATKDANSGLIVNKIDNGNPSFTPTVSTSTIAIATAGDDPDGNGTPQYTWERLGIDDMDWVTVSTMSSTYNILPQAADNARYRVRISHTDAQGYVFESRLGPFRTDIDSDDDGLIDIYYLEDLNNVRHQMDGSGYKESSTADKNHCRLSWPILATAMN